jgi:hypothetical protein
LIQYVLRVQPDGPVEWRMEAFPSDCVNRFVLALVQISHLLSHPPSPLLLIPTRIFSTSPFPSPRQADWKLLRTQHGDHHPPSLSYRSTALSADMSCSDDLTADDLTNSVATQVLERVSAGEGSNANLWGHIDRDK